MADSPWRQLANVPRGNLFRGYHRCNPSRRTQDNVRISGNADSSSRQGICFTVCDGVKREDVSKFFWQNFKWGGGIVNLSLPCTNQDNRGSFSLDRFFFSCIRRVALSFVFSYARWWFASCCFRFRFNARCPCAMRELPYFLVRFVTPLGRWSGNLRIVGECFRLALFGNKPWWIFRLISRQICSRR